MALLLYPNFISAPISLIAPSDAALSLNSVEGFISLNYSRVFGGRETLEMSGDDALGGRFKRGEDHQPMFFKVFIRQYSSDRMLIPKGFMEGIMKQEKEGCASLVGPSGEKWRVSIIKKKAKWFIDEGWKVFWEDNSIAETDFLVFTYAGKMKFYVKIFGPHGCQKPSGYLAKCTKDNRATFTASQQKARVPEKKGRGRPHVVTAEERRVADSFTSKHPFFVRTLHWKANKSPVLHIPRSFLNKHALTCFHNENISLFNQNGYCLLVKVVEYPYVFSLCGGLVRFLHESRARHGDILILEVLDASPLKLMVHVVDGTIKP